MTAEKKTNQFSDFKSYRGETVNTVSVNISFQVKTEFQLYLIRNKPSVGKGSNFTDDVATTIHT